MLASPSSPEESTYDVNVIPMNFRTDYIPIHGKAGEFREVHRVDLVKKGQNGESTPWSIKDLKQDQILWPVIGPFYERWLEGQEDPEVGTPIDCLPFLPPTLIPSLRLLHILSAEDLAGTTDSDLERIGFNARTWREKARKYIEAKKGDAQLADALVERDAENAQLRKEVDELREQVNSLVAVSRDQTLTYKETAHTEPVPVKRKPGRPRKNPQ